MHVWLNSGKATDKLQAAEFKLKFNGNLLTYTNLETESGYSLVNDTATVNQTDTDGNSYLDIKLVNMGSEPGGAVEMIKVYFLAKANGTINLEIQNGKLMIAGQATTWDVAANNISKVNVGEMAVTPTAILAVTATPTSTETGAACGKRCNDDKGCGSGQTCTPVWWACKKAIPKDVNDKLKNNQDLNLDQVNKMIKDCPENEKVLPTGYKTLKTVKMPVFYGVCRSKTCLNSVDCSCGAIVPTVTLTPTVVVVPTSTPTPPAVTSTPTPGSMSCAQGSELKTFTDDFSGTNLDATKWWTWSNSGGTVGQSTGLMAREWGLDQMG